MAASIPRTHVAEGNIVAPFADLTMDEFVALVAAHPDVRYHFNAAGDVIQKSPTFLHADVQGVIVTHFNIWLWQGALPGYRAGVEPTYDLGDWRCQPDVAIDLRQGRVFPKQAPLVAVEVRSDSNTWPELREKAARYLEHGTQMVWLVDTDARLLELHVPDAAPRTLRGADLIDGGAVLPGFRLPLGDLFPKATD